MTTTKTTFTPGQIVIDPLTSDVATGCNAILGGVEGSFFWNGVKIPFHVAASQSVFGLMLLLFLARFTWRTKQVAQVCPYIGLILVTFQDIIAAGSHESPFEGSSPMWRALAIALLFFYPKWAPESHEKER